MNVTLKPGRTLISTKSLQALASSLGGSSQQSESRNHRTELLTCQVLVGGLGPQHTCPVAGGMACSSCQKVPSVVLLHVLKTLHFPALIREETCRTMPPKREDNKREPPPQMKVSLTAEGCRQGLLHRAVSPQLLTPLSWPGSGGSNALRTF